MARNMYGATSADFTLTAGGRVVPGATLTVWTARTGGTQVTDLLDVNSVACTTVTSGADGSVVFYGPNNEKATLWLDSGQGSRIAVRPVDITGETGATPALTIGTVTTGTAAATITGTDEDPVLNLTIPPAANDSITSEMIAANAVTSAKIADGTIVSSDVAADTFAAHATVGNLLTLNQATGTGGGWYGLNATFDTTTDSGDTVGRYTLTATGAIDFANLLASTAFGVGEVRTVLVDVKSSRSQVIRLAGHGYDAGWAGADNLPTRSITVAANTWTTIAVTATPATAKAYVGLVLRVDAGQSGDVILVRRASIHRGAAGVWSLPGLPITGQSPIAVNGAVELSGTGSPEGVVTAAPGSTWLQTDATTDVKGWIRWVKATGTGNTGWVAGPEADTGWRNIAALLINSWTANMIQMRRVGSRVEVKSGLLKGGATISTQMLVIPTGFDFSSGAVNGTVFREDGVSGTPGWLLAAHSTLNAYGGMLDGSSWTVNHGVSMETSWLTDDAWPSVLPGSAA